MQTDCKPLLYSHYDVTFQEVPGEISLVFDITGCPHHCPDCHSKFLWEYSGTPLLENLSSVINKYWSMITCVCFMGGDQNKIELLKACNIAHRYNLKTCLYTGLDYPSFRHLMYDGGPRNYGVYFNFIKVGPYVSEFGGLDDPKTNQRFYELRGNVPIDKTILFQKEYK